MIVKLARVLIPLLLTITSTLWWASYVGAETRLSEAFVEESLVSYHWEPTTARKLATAVRAEYAILPRTQNALLVERCPWEQSRIYINSIYATSPALTANYLEHEYHHLADYMRTCNYDVTTIARDYMSLGTTYRSVDIYSRLPQEYTTVQHYNHDLIASLNWDISKLPQWYVDKYFWYMVPIPPVSAVIVPTPVEHIIDAPRPPPSTLGYRVILPRMDLKVAT